MDHMRISGTEPSKYTLYFAMSRWLIQNNVDYNNKVIDILTLNAYFVFGKSLDSSFNLLDNVDLKLCDIYLVHDFRQFVLKVIIIPVYSRSGVIQIRIPNN